MMHYTTRILSATSDDPTQWDLSPAIEALKAGEVVGIPTETVYGLAGNALSENAVASIYTAKGRPSDNPLIVHIAQWGDLLPLVSHLPEEALPLATAFWPGPLTMIFPRSSQVPDKTAGGLPTVAIRMPAHPVAKAIIQACGFPIAAPSANQSGAPSPTTATHVLHDLGGHIPFIVDGGQATVGLESTVLSLTGEEPVILRPGAISKEMISTVLGKPIRLHENLFHTLESGVKVASPGMKYQHYAPNTPLTLFFGNREEYVQKVTAESMGALCFEEDLPFLENTPALSYGKSEDFMTQSAQLFATLRAVDDLPAGKVLVHASSDEQAMAILNRLLRSAAFRVEGEVPHFMERN